MTCAAGADGDGGADAGTMQGSYRLFGHSMVRRKIITLNKMLSTSRLNSRKRVLDEVTSTSRMKSVWKSGVRAALRDQHIPDLHDYYDFHTNLSSRLEVVRNSVLDGLYSPQLPFRITLEKGKGICRQVPLLSPEDAITIESLGSYLLRPIRRKQPSKQAYYSRRTAGPKSINQFDGDPSYPWWVLWPKFQEEIFKFSRHSDYTVVADVATFYDNVDFRQLRNYLSHLIKNSEPLLDFLFYLLERFSWRPDYLPHPHRGLPQSDIDCVRLVAHALLFEVDEYLKAHAGNQFVRWMDDIDFASDTVEEAHRHLKSIDELLQSRGLHLNSAKCKILTSEEASRYFHINTNIYLSVLQRGIKQGKAKNRPLRRQRFSLQSRFKTFEPDRPHGQAKKVLKRFLNIAASLDDSSFSDTAIDLITDEPLLRETVFRYFKRIGWSKQREDAVVAFAESTVDDASLFKAVQLLLHWQPVNIVAYAGRMRDLITLLSLKGPVRFLASIWLAVKFSSDRQLDHLIVTNTSLWSRNSWLGRQIACTYPRCSYRTQISIVNAVHSFGLRDAKLVLDSYDRLSSADYEKRYSNSVQGYLLATKADGYYPPSKVLLALSLLRGQYSLPLKDQIYFDLRQLVRDPIYRFRFMKARY